MTALGRDLAALVSYEGLVRRGGPFSADFCDEFRDPRLDPAKCANFAP